MTDNNIGSAAVPILSARAAEIIEAMLLLHDLGKPVEFIARQLDLTAVEVVAIIKTGQIPVRKKTLFEKEPERQNTKPVSRSEGVKRALQIHIADTANTQQIAGVRR